MDISLWGSSWAFLTGSKGHVVKKKKSTVAFSSPFFFTSELKSVLLVPGKAEYTVGLVKSDTPGYLII